MKNMNPMQNSEDLFYRINRLSAEAEWGIDELQAALREEDINPNILVNTVQAKIQGYLNTQEQLDEEETNGSISHSLPLLNALRKYTGLPAPTVAKELGVPLAFLSAIDRYPESVPYSWRAEISARAERILRISRNVVMASFENSLHFELAALSDNSTDTINYEEILEQSGMSDEDKQFWLSLASDG